VTAPTPGIGRVVVDPRFRARRIAVRREAGRRRLRRLLVLVAVAAVALTAVIVLKSPLLDVDDIDVDGGRTVGADAIRDVAGIGIGSPLLLADIDEAEAAIEELAWVADATVTRDLPDAVRISVVEREPAALVSIAGTELLVDGSGRVLVDGDVPATVPRQPPFVTVLGPPADRAPAVGRTVDRDLRAAIELAGRLRENPAGVVSAVRLRPSLQLVLAGGGLVEMGDDSDLDAKVEAVRTTVARVELTCLRVLDVRVPTHPVLTRGDTCP
jgi:cell division protein FtsQ